MKIDRNNYEDFLIQKLEGQLSNEQNAELDLFLHNNSDIQSEWEAFELIRLIPDESVVYEHKELLKKKESAGIIPFYRTLMYATSIAASLLLVFFISQKYFFKQTQKNPSLVAVNNSIKNNKTENDTSEVKSLNNNLIVAENYSSNNQSSNGSENKTINNLQKTNSSLITNQINQVRISDDIQPMKPIVAGVVRTFPRVSYASFIWTKGLTVPHSPSRSVNEAGAWLQVASILGSEIIRLSGRGERLNKAPLELQFKNKPVQLNINNPYLRLNKFLSIKKKNSNNK